MSSRSPHSPFVPWLSRRSFLGSAILTAAAWRELGLPPVQAAGAAEAKAESRREESVLPEGGAPAALDFPHFPDRLHAFVWRNWPLISVERLASVLGARPEDIRAVGKSMSLPDSAPAPDAVKRGALTIIRRNWHLLPYSQLLELLGWSAAELAYTLREDDFFYIKLGSLKPRCAPLRWSAPDAAAAKGAAWIRQVLAEEFPDSAGLCGKDPLFAFAARLAEPPPGGSPALTEKAAGNEPLRMCYSCFGLYGDPLLNPELDPYPEGLLQRLRQSGVNAVWLPALLSRLSPFPWEPALSGDVEKRREILRALVARAGRHGISVILYLNEPRMMPLGFFKDHPELQGVVSGDHAALCTSAPAVRDYLREAMAGLCRAVPDLGGFFTISASENPTHCWSHGAGASCPRCAPEGPAKVVARLHQDLAEGIAKAGGKQRLIVWDWAWGDWAEEAIAGLPPQVSLMSVSEWSLPIQRGGIASEVGEYCLSATGPGPRALRHWKAARARGLRVIAKIQAALSWEFSAAPWLPVVNQTIDHARALRDAGVEDLMLGWTLGGSPSPNFEALHSGIESAARQRAGERAPELLAFWKECSRSFREFPFHIGVVYQAPLQFGPANLLWARPTGYQAAMVGLAYDDLESWRAVYPADIFIQQLWKTAAGFQTAVDGFRQSWPEAPPAVRQEMDFAETAALHWRSVAAQSRFIQIRGQSDDAPTTERKALLAAETAASKRLHTLQSADSRLGFEASNQYYYIPLDLVEKVLCCRHLAKGTA